MSSNVPVGIYTVSVVLNIVFIVTLLYLYGTFKLQ